MDRNEMEMEQKNGKSQNENVRYGIYTHVALFK